MPPLISSKASPVRAIGLTLLPFKKADAVDTESKNDAFLVLKFNALCPEGRRKILESVARYLITLCEEMCHCGWFNKMLNGQQFCRTFRAERMLRRRVEVQKVARQTERKQHEQYRVTVIKPRNKK